MLVTSAWNWIPQAGRPSTRNDCRHDGAVGEGHTARRKGEGVVVPLEEGRARGERAEDRIRLSGLGERDLVPADLRRAHAADGRAGGAGEHLRAEAYAEDRYLRGEDVLQERLLALQPGEAVVLVGMLGAAEDHDRVVAPRRLG